MNRYTITVALLDLPILGVLVRTQTATFSLFAFSLLLIVEFVFLFVVLPRLQQQRGVSVRFNVHLSIIFVLAWFIALVLYGKYFSGERKSPPLLQRQAAPSNLVVFNAAAARLASYGTGQTIRIWDVSPKSLNDLQAKEDAAPLQPLREIPGKDEKPYTKFPDIFTSVAYSPDDSLIAFGSTDKGIRLWNFREKLIVRELVGHQANVLVLAFSPDGSLLASGSEDKTARVWRIADGTLVQELKGHGERVTSLAFSPDGKYLATGSADKSVRLWQASDWTLVREYKGHSDPIIGLALTATDLISVSDKRTLRRWKLDSDTLIEEVYKDAPKSITGVAFSPDRKFFASAGSDKNIEVWLTTGTPVVLKNPLYTYTGATDAITALQYDPASARLVSAGKDKAVRIWDAKTSKLVQTMTHDSDVNGVTFDGSGNSIISVSSDKTVRTWQVLGQEPGKPLYKYEGESESITHVGFNADASNTVTVSRDGYVRTWRTEDGTLLSEQVWKPYQLTAMAVHPNDGTVAVGNVRGTVRLVKPGGFGRIDAYSQQPVYSLAYSPEGKLLAGGGVDQPIKLWRSDGRFLFDLPPQGGQITSLVFSPDGTALASASSNQTVRVWQLTPGDSITYTIPSTLPVMATPITSMAFGQNGQTLVVGTADGMIRMWNVANGGMLEEVNGLPQSISGLAVTKDDIVLAAGITAATSDLRVWTSGDLKEIRGSPLSRYSMSRSFVGNETIRLFSAFAIGGVISILVVIFIIFVFSTFAARVLITQNPQYALSAARRFAFDTQLGIHKIVQTVTEGKVKTISPASPLAKYGGPGTLTVEEGHVAVLVRGGQFSRIVPSGSVTLDRSETVSRAYYLGPMTDQWQIPNVVTRDQLVISSFVVQVDCQINSGDRSKNSGTLQYDEQVIRRIWDRRTSLPNQRTEDTTKKTESVTKDEHAADWHEPLTHVIESAVRDVVARCNLNDLILLYGRTRNVIDTEIIRKINATAGQFPGLEIRAMAVDVQQVSIPPDASAKMWRLWDTQMEDSISTLTAIIAQRRLKAQGAGEAEAVREVERIKFNFRTALIGQIAGLFQGATINNPDVAVRILAMIEELTKSLVREDVGSVRYLETLDEFAKIKGDKTLVLGQEGLTGTSESSKSEGTTSIGQLNVEQ